MNTEHLVLNLGSEISNPKPAGSSEAPNPTRQKAGLSSWVTSDGTKGLFSVGSVL